MNDDQVIEIQNYDDLIRERKRLETLIENQKNIIRHDLDELKAEFKKEIRPAVEAAAVLKKFARPETRVSAVANFAATLVFDLALKAVFKKSNILVQTLLPKILKNYASHWLHRVYANPTQITSHRPSHQREI